MVFRLGKLLPEPKGPGIVLVFRPIDALVRVGLRTAVRDVPPQDIITRDNVSVKVNAVVYYRVIDPRRAIVDVENYTYATSQLAQTTLRSVLGQAELDELCSPSVIVSISSYSRFSTIRRTLGYQSLGCRSQTCRSAGRHAARDGAEQAEAERAKRAKIHTCQG